MKQTPNITVQFHPGFAVDNGAERGDTITYLEAEMDYSGNFLLIWSKHNTYVIPFAQVKRIYRTNQYTEEVTSTHAENTPVPWPTEMQ